ncbi:class I SAM-dependent methyltransferase [Geomesophilobacter sediminis]|uniref:Class I SAM-dependent methyltransferase n=1 Tax=Geomesophilobacter sediminis TaxID=2798584 RepID=A0A8J7M254_9BACT|nr:class I SAM-dependent methyltransferase [Geomesophilobacter sediminis]MBJ6727320.1 class I SAM-dependent methyltransferase [Geomesophilobacter sediminis]
MSNSLPKTLEPRATGTDPLYGTGQITVSPSPVALPTAPQKIRKRSPLIGLIKMLLPVADLCLAPFVYPSAFLLKLVRSAGVHRMPLCRRALLAVGVFPIRNHYFEPLFDTRALRHSLEQGRRLPGITWNVTEQLRLLGSFRYADEMKGIPDHPAGNLDFHFNNVAFESGDAEFLYSLIRQKKPARIFEIGSGHSTRMARRAIKRNREETPDYRCQHVCIEPYEQPWLEQVGVRVVRRRVEDLDPAFFAVLEENDLLFIDSSHVIRPQGDVLFEYLELLSTLKPGVIVHVHDIFSPRDYPKEWVADEVRLWNEQYLLEAFLTGNRDWKILAAVNYLHHNHFEALKAACPYLTREDNPGSFYLQKVA